MRLTHSFVQVVVALSDDVMGQHWGYQLSKRSGVRSGVLYPILQRLLDAGWLEDGWEDPTEVQGKRPPRRYYTLTDEGRKGIGGVLEQARSDARFTPIYQWAGGAT